MRIRDLNELIENGKRLKGRWKLGKNGELQFNRSDKDEEIALRASVVAAEPEALVVSVTEKQSDQRSVTRLARLSGAWSLDRRNRLGFGVERGSGKNDVIGFDGSWQLDKNQQLIFRTRRTRLKTKVNRSQEFVFRGFWDLSSKNRLVYSLSGDSGSVFDFRGSFQTKSILAKRGEIRYQLGAGSTGSPRRGVAPQTFILFGKWKYSDALGLAFELQNSRVKRAIEFSADFKLNSRDDLAVTLKGRDGQKLGMELVFSRELPGDGQAFVRIKKDLEESRIEAGARRSW